MNKIIQAILLIFTLFLLFPKIVFAATITGQTQAWNNQLTTWQAMQELGDNLSGTLSSVTFRVSTSRPNSQQFDYTAQNTRLYDKSNNSFVRGCVPAEANPYDQRRGLIFNTSNVPLGFEDVTVDFSCRNYVFVPGHRYLILITNANTFSKILFAGVAYGAGGNGGADLFSFGGLRYADGVPWILDHTLGSCDPVAYIWGSPILRPLNGCNIWTTPQDDLYFVLSDTTPEPSPSKTPLIFIPGIGGSELKASEDLIWNKDNGHGGTYNRAYTTGEKVWVNEGEAILPGDDDYFDVLRMKPDGQTGEANLELAGNIYSGSYGAAINFFTSNGYTLDKDLFVFPYDWRKDVALTAPLLDQKIETIKGQTGSTKVDIVAHSLGGLVARNYINDPVRAGKVRKLITLGTPNLGTPFFLKSLMYGNCLSKPLLTNLNIPFCLGLTDSEIKDVVQNMISGYESAPSQKYYEFYNGSDSDHPLPFVDNRDIDSNGITGFLNYQQIKALLANLKYNTTLFNPTESFHQLDNNLGNVNGVDVSLISGSGMATTGQIIEDYAVNLTGIKIAKTDIRKINGDDTVPLFSASLTDGSKSIAGSAKIYYANQQHSNLVFDGPSMNLVKNILAGDNTMPTGTSNQPYTFNGNALSVHSPVLIHAYDASGNHMGPLANGDFEAKIPGSTYEVLGDAKFIFLPNSGQYNLKFEATDRGSFDFKIRNYENNINDKTILYKNVPLSSNTKAETTFDTTSVEPPVLHIDSDGNGTVDSQMSATGTLSGSAVYDQIAPKTTANLSGTSGNNGWYKSDVEVTLLAQDEDGGSGISKTEYSLDDGQTVQIYSAPFTISQEGITKLKFRSVDQAGNEEVPQEIEIKIDKTAPAVTLSASPNQLWPVNKKMIDVTVTGNISDNLSGVASRSFIVTDEYQKPMPQLSDFNQVIKLEAWRNGDDMDGRIYTIQVLGMDLAGNQNVTTTQVTVPHDQGKR